MNENDANVINLDPVFSRGFLVDPSTRTSRITAD